MVEMKTEPKRRDDHKNDLEYSENCGEYANTKVVEGVKDSSNDDNNTRLHLNRLCKQAGRGVDGNSSIGTSINDDDGWNDVREWFERHNDSVSEEAILECGKFNQTALHLACGNDPPVDIIEKMTKLAPMALEIPDKFGGTALHHACNNIASLEVIHVLVASYPDGTIAVNNRGLTPLHILVGKTDVPPLPEVVTLLSAFGAAAYPDSNGMVPLHYACAYGVSEVVLNILLDADAETVNVADNKGRTPLYYAMGNCQRNTSPMIVSTLLEILSSDCEDEDNNLRKNTILPLRILSVRTAKLDNFPKERENAKRCLDSHLNYVTSIIMNSNIDLMETEFLTTLQSLPEWLRDLSVVNPSVQNILNEKVSQRFPSAVLLMDLYITCGIILCYSINISLALTTESYWTQEIGIPIVNLIPLYLGAIYFFLREFVQIMSMSSLGLFSHWIKDATNYLDVLFIGIVLFWAIVMGGIWRLNNDVFRAFAAFSSFILYLSFLSFLRSLYFEFAVFVSGLWNVLQLLVAFITSTMIILLMFMQIFFTMFQQTNGCIWEKSMSNFTMNECDIVDPFTTSMSALTSNEKEILSEKICVCELERLNSEDPFCTYWTTFLKVYTMLLGEIDENMFLGGNRLSLWFFVIFMFLVVILLASVLIALVTDSYDIIKNERAAIAFWSNRLNFIAEMDAISSGPWKKKVKNMISTIFCRFRKHRSKKDNEEEKISTLDSFLSNEVMRDMWKQMMQLIFEKSSLKNFDRNFFSKELWSYVIARLVTTFYIVPLWISIGIFSAGYLWPPQIREHLFRQKVSSELQYKDDLYNMEKRIAEVEALRKDIEMLHEDINKQIGLENEEAKQVKMRIMEMKTHVMHEMKEIKQMITLLFELQAGMAVT